MAKTLEELGYWLKQDFRDTEHPSMTYEKTYMGGYQKSTFIFDTIHGGRWTFECYYLEFCFNRECDWTPQQREGFNPASKSFIGCNVGSWHRVEPVLTAEECRAVADLIERLERERVSE